MGGATPFTYQPLDHTRNEIRLLRLLPQRDDDWQTTIRCELFHASLDKNPSYDALSYVWGSEIKPFMISVNNNSLAVTMNLFEALLHLRRTLTGQELSARQTPGYSLWSSHLWVDAICIDQDNIRERNHQVSFMQRIFSRASFVHVWLGNFKLVPVQSSQDFLRWLHATQRFIPRRHALAHAHETLSHLTRDETIASNFEKILQAQWFTRMWVVQELVCSKMAIAHVGYSQLPWNMLVDSMDRLLDVQTGTASAQSWSRIQSLVKYRDDYQRNQPRALLDLIYDSRHLEANERLDRVFALLGICSPHDISVDYALSEAELAFKLTCHHVATRHDLSFFTGSEPCEPNIDLGPSWALRSLSIADQYPALRQRRLTQKIYPYMAPKVDGRMLRVHGFILGYFETPWPNRDTTYYALVAGLCALLILEKRDGVYFVVDVYTDFEAVPDARNLKGASYFVPLRREYTTSAFCEGWRPGTFPEYLKLVVDKMEYLWNQLLRHKVEFMEEIILS